MSFNKLSHISFLLIFLLVFNFTVPTMAQTNTQEEEEQILSSDLRNEMFSSYLENSDSDIDTNYTDVSHITDQEFFGEWDMEKQEWKTVGKLNYDYSPELAEVERLVKLNSYAMAKDALYEYYKNRTNIPRADFDSNISWHGNILWMRDACYFSENAVALANITNVTDEYKEYTIDLLGTVKGGVFLLSSINKTADMIEIASRETEYSPRLLIKKSDGSEITLEPSKDTYIRAFDPEENYSYDNYGHSEKLYVKDSYYDYGNGTYSPISSDTRRTYIAFDSTKIPSDAVRMYLTIYAKIVPEEDVEAATEDDLELIVFDAYNESWDEYKKEENEFAPMTWADYKISHYSWNGIPGGYDWKRPDNVPSEWHYNVTRFPDVVSLAKSTLISGNTDYIKKSLSLFLDFIKDTNGQIETVGVPQSRDQEPKHRITNTPGLVATYLESDIFNGEALTAILKWLWEEMTYMYNGAGCIYTGPNCEAQSNNYAETNRAFWVCEGVETACAYFPEYADHDMWKELCDERLETVTKIILNEDGCYQEPTFSYPTSLLGDYVDLWNELERTGQEIPDWYKERVSGLAKYIMNISWPNHRQANFGEGDTGSSLGSLNSYLTVVDDENIKYVATDGTDGKEPDYTSVYYDALKIAAVRTGWTQDDSMLIMNAKNGGNHNHKDSLHMIFFYDGMDLLADTGFTSYDGGHPHFKWQRHTTRSHNTIEIDGKPQRGSDFLGNTAADSSKWNGESDLDLYAGKYTDRINAWTDATEGFRHHRNVSYIKNQNFIIVSDMVEPSDNEVHTYTQNWHTSATEKSDARIDTKSKTGKTNYYSRPNIIITQANADNLNLTLETGYSKDSATPTKYFCYTQTEQGPVAYNTILTPTSVGEEVNVNVTDIDTNVDPAIASAMSINIFRNDDDLLNVFYYNSFEETPENRTFAGYSTDCSNITIQQDIDEIPLYMSMYNGTNVVRDGENIISSDIPIEDIEIMFDGSTAVITSADEDVKNAKLTIMAPSKIKNVTINDEAVDFIYNDGSIYLNNSAEVDFTADSGYVVRLTATGENGNTYPVTIDIPANSLESGNLLMPQCILENKLFKISFGNAVLTSSAKITIAGHNDKNVFMNGTNITNTIEVGSDLQYADAHVTVGSPALERAREDLIIWTKNVDVFTISASTQAPGNEFDNQGGSRNPGIQAFPKGGGGLASSGEEKKDEEEAVKFVFNDCKGHWAENEIKYMYSKGFIKGVGENFFAPDNNISRAEFAAIVVRVLNLEQLSYTGTFDDIESNDWYASIAESANKAGIMQGAYNLFRPNDNITREEMAVILMRVYNMTKEYTAQNPPVFKDTPKISDWALEAVTDAYELGLINGVGNSMFAPKENATRAQATVVLKRLLEIH